MGENRHQKEPSEPFDAGVYLKRWGQAMRHAREAARLSLRQLEYIVGLSASSISAFENGEQWMSMAKFLHICAVLHVPLCHVLPDHTAPPIREAVAILMARSETAQREVVRWLQSFQYIERSANTPAVSVSPQKK